MAFNYSLNFDKLGENLLPNNKRLVKYKSFVSTLLSPLAWLHNRFFYDYKEGAAYAPYNNATQYYRGDIVIYLDKSIYYCLNDSLGNIPTNSAYWYKVQDVYLGIKERIYYQPQRLTFEYALNRFFGQLFVNPPATNVIYISNNTIDANGMVIGLNDADTALIPELLGFNNYVGSTPPSSNIYAFTIYYPVYLPATLSLTTSEFESILKQQADKIKLAGTFYNIATY